ncbi:hypothetical protein [Breznakia pachnodae]|uniref:Uncharacterized protein n=1 Tax=Breznakia pachnodae TaxID=265178 RepID=A0ABU0E790_9FIRM|nr:hypothetical protein [Breznakia pachnodae]MDQ0362573.1 hypothetical protein [Breznakia pachnodae]
MKAENFRFAVAAFTTLVYVVLIGYKLYFNEDLEPTGILSLMIILWQIFVELNDINRKLNRDNRKELE